MTPWLEFLWLNTPAWERAVCLVMLAVPALAALFGIVGWARERLRANP